ncbi:hypothetical protein QEN19_000638 [Hanseniaspora menglaensis]
MTEIVYPNGGTNFEEEHIKQIPSSPTKFSAFNISKFNNANVSTPYGAYHNISDAEHNSDQENDFFGDIIYLKSGQYNNFKRETEVLNNTENEICKNEIETVGDVVDFPKLRSIQRNPFNSNKRISEESTLVSFQKLFFQQNPRKSSNISSSNSERTLITSRLKTEHNEKATSFIQKNTNVFKNNTTDPIINFETITRDKLKSLDMLLDNLIDIQQQFYNTDDFQYLILSSKFFQESSFDPKDSGRVFSIPLKQSMVNLSTSNLSSADEENLSEGNSSTKNTDTLTKHNILSCILSFKKIKKQKTFLKLPKCLNLLTLILNQKIIECKTKYIEFKNYLSNFINNLEAFNFKLEKIECVKNSTTESVIRSSVTPLLINILMSLENLINQGLPTSNNFWTYYLPMFFQDVHFLENITSIVYSSDIHEFIFQFRKIIQLYLLFLIPSNNVVYTNENWLFIFPDLNRRIIPKHIISTINTLILNFDQINGYIKTGKELLGNSTIINWSKKQDPYISLEEISEFDLQTPSSQNYEYSELMQKIPIGKELAMLEPVCNYNDYETLQSTLQNLVVSFSINASINRIDTELDFFLKLWTNYKLSLSGTLFKESKTDYDGVSNHYEKENTFFLQESLHPPNIKFLDTLKTLSDVELNAKLQLKLKELHVENVGAKKKKSQVSLNNIKSSYTEFQNLKEDDIALYYQLDEIKQLQTLHEETDVYF